MENTGDIIKKLRESQGMTQQQLADLVGAKTYTTITKWEKGDNFPKGKEIIKLCEIFNVSADYILGLAMEEVDAIPDVKMDNIISNNIKKIMRNHQINQHELAKIAGVSDSAADQWISGKSVPRMKTLQKIADYFHLPKNDILTEEPKSPYLINSSPATVKIPILGVIACADSIYTEANFAGFRYESLDNLPNGNMVYLEVKSDRMEPTIPNGSFVLIREQSEVGYGEIAAVLVNGDTEATLQRVKWQGDTILLMPDNPKYSPYIVDEQNPAHIIGKAVRYVQEL